MLRIFTLIMSTSLLIGFSAGGFACEKHQKMAEAKNTQVQADMKETLQNPNGSAEQIVSVEEISAAQSSSAQPSSLEPAKNVAVKAENKKEAVSDVQKQNSDKESASATPATVKSVTAAPTNAPAAKSAATPAPAAPVAVNNENTKENESADVQAKADLEVLDFVLAGNVESREPKEIVENFGKEAERGFAFARLSAKTPSDVTFVWYRNDQPVSRIKVGVQAAKQWRTFSSVKLRPGQWKVQLVASNDNDKVLAEKSFIIE